MRGIETSVYLTLKPGRQSFQDRRNVYDFSIGRMTHKKPALKAGERLIRLRVTVPADFFSDDLITAEIGLSPRDIAGIGVSTEKE